MRIELDGYEKPFVLRHIGAAITAIAADSEQEYRLQPKDLTACAEPMLAPPHVMPEAPSVLGMPVKIDPTLPPDVVQMTGEGQTVAVVNVGTVEVIDEEDEAGWPDPPGGTSDITDLDSAGFPWDARIHAGSKAKMKADGTWKLKPGVDKALVEQVRAGASMTKLSDEVTKPLLDAVTVPPPPPATLSDAVTVSAELQAPLAPPVAAAPANFAELIQEVTKRITAGSLTADQVNGAVALATGGQLTMCNQLAARQDLIPAVWAVLVPA